MSAKSILCTIGPASLDPEILRRFQALGVNLFRINLSHTPLDRVRSVISFLQTHSSVPICLDSEGAQIRTAPSWPDALKLEENTILEIGDTANALHPILSLTPENICRQLQLGDFITLDFHGAVARVIRLRRGGATLRVLNGGAVGRNKAVTVHREIELPAITPKDRAAIEIGLEMGVKNFALSFANRPADVGEMRRLTGPEATIISKIESISGVSHLDEIVRESDAILIDRGDLSRQVPLERIPPLQKEIVRRAKTLGCPVYVATNLLESMVQSPIPTRAEVNDIYNTLADGADGLVLAAETAIGHFPEMCVRMVARVMAEYERITPLGAAVDQNWLVQAHGGRPVGLDLVVG